MASLIEPGQAEADDPQADPLVRFLGRVAGAGVSTCIRNLKARLFALESGDVVIPIVAGVDGGGACYLATFTHMYMDGAAAELAGSRNVLLRALAPGSRLPARSHGRLGAITSSR